MRVVVDFDLCQGHGVCEGEAPEVFQLDEQGYLSILMEEPPEELREKVDLAVMHCPTMAITVEG